MPTPVTPHQVVVQHNVIRKAAILGPGWIGVDLAAASLVTIGAVLVGAWIFSLGRSGHGG